MRIASLSPRLGLSLLALAVAACGGSDSGYGAPGGAALAERARKLAKPHEFTPTPCVVDRLVKQPATAPGLPRLTNAELAAAGACVLPYQKEVYAGTRHPLATTWTNWKPVSTQPYRSEHEAYLMAYANPLAATYTDYEGLRPLPAGARLAKSSFGVSPDGKVSVGPLFFMEKLETGFWPAYGDWRFTLIAGSGRIAGVSKGDGAENVEYCAVCHTQAKKTDFLMLVPEPYRVKG